MRKGSFRRRHIAKLSALIAAGILLTPHVAFAQTDGDEMCTKAGHVQVFSDSSRAWEDSGGLCTPNGPDGPANGDEKCGATGFTVKFVAKTGRWRNTQVECGTVQHSNTLRVLR